MIAPRSPRTLIAAVALVAAATACVPPPTTPTVPAIYPPCVGAPTCVVAQNAQFAAFALSDDGRIMATSSLTTVVPGEQYESTIALVGIDDRWYRQVAVLDGTHAPVGDLVMTPDAETLVFASDTANGQPADPNAGLEVYRRSTGTLTRVTGPGAWTPLAVSDDGRVVVALENSAFGPEYGLWKFDLVAGTSQRLTNAFGTAALSGDGRYVVLRSGGQLVRRDLTDGTEVALPEFNALEHATLSGDGARIAGSASDPFTPTGFEYLDVGDPAWTQLSSAPAVGAPRLSRDGSHLIAGASMGSPLPVPTVVDWNLVAGTLSVIAPYSNLAAVSPNGNHVLYIPAGGGTTVLRWSR